jgi:hypothetical protein
LGVGYSLATAAKIALAPSPKRALEIDRANEERQERDCGGHKQPEDQLEEIFPVGPISGQVLPWSVAPSPAGRYDAPHSMSAIGFEKPGVFPRHERRRVQRH